MKRNRSLFVLLVLTAIVILPPATWAKWIPLGLEDVKVSALDLHSGCMYAATDDGVYRMTVNEPELGWTAIGLQGQAIQSILVLNDRMIMAGPATGTVAMYRTLDGGATWNAYENGFDGGVVYDFERFPGQTDTIFAVGAGYIAKTYNGGVSWKVVWGSWTGGGTNVFIQLDPNAANILWAGGKSATAAPVLLKSSDGGEIWTVSNVAGGTNTCNDITIYPGNSNTAWVSGNGIIWKTTTGGASWASVFTDNLNFYSVAIDSVRAGHMYTSGGYASTPLKAYVSRDEGATWATCTEETNAVNTAYDMVLVSHADRNILYYATDYGVFQLTDLLGDNPCGYVCGDCDCSGDNCNIGDLTYMVQWMFHNGPQPEMTELADVDGNTTVNIGDMVYLVEYMFSYGPELNCTF